MFRSLRHYSEFSSELSELESPARRQLAFDIVQGLGLVRACFWLYLSRSIRILQLIGAVADKPSGPLSSAEVVEHAVSSDVRKARSTSVGIG